MIYQKRFGVELKKPHFVWVSWNVFFFAKAYDLIELLAYLNCLKKVFTENNHWKILKSIVTFLLHLKFKINYESKEINWNLKNMAYYFY